MRKKRATSYARSLALLATLASLSAKTSENISFYQDILSGQVSNHLEYQNLFYDGLNI